MKSFPFLCKQAARISVLLSLGISLASNAALVGRDLDGNLATAEAYYDTDQNITWLADANYAQTSGYHVNGYMAWNEANAWAATLNFGSVTGWRLPETVDIGYRSCPHGYSGTQCGFNVDTSTSEMSYMFYETLGNLAYYDTAANPEQPGWGLTNTGPFLNLLPGLYWSATEYTRVPNRAWNFFFRYGNQSRDLKTNVHLAWAVHTGDVGASVVPVPAAAWLFGSALLGLIGLKRKNRFNH